MTLQIKTLAQYQEVYQQSIENPGVFWGGTSKYLHLAQKLG